MFRFLLGIGLEVEELFGFLFVFAQEQCVVLRLLFGIGLEVKELFSFLLVFAQEKSVVLCFLFGVGLEMSYLPGLLLVFILEQNGVPAFFLNFAPKERQFFNSTGIALRFLPQGQRGCGGGIQGINVLFLRLRGAKQFLEKGSVF